MKACLPEMKKAVVLLSGGIDSTTCLAVAVNELGTENVTALTVYYGQKHVKELQCAQQIAAHFGVNHIVRDLNGVFDLDPQNPLLQGGKEIPLKSYAEQLEEKPGTVQTYVPFRNGLLLSYAAAIAYSIGAEYVFYGAHADDAAGRAYPDCTPEFYESMNRAIYHGTGEVVRLYAPLIDYNKTQVIALGYAHSAPYELTWSCYKGLLYACGECGTCIDRRQAFANNYLKDPITYLDETDDDGDSGDQGIEGKYPDE